MGFALTQAKKSFGVDLNIQYLVVDYSSPAQIAEVLRANQVEVVISAIGIVFEDTHLAQMNLIDGASQSGTVVRFAPSEYAIDYAEAMKRRVHSLLRVMNPTDTMLQRFPVSCTWPGGIQVQSVQSGGL